MKPVKFLIFTLWINIKNMPKRKYFKVRLSYDWIRVQELSKNLFLYFLSRLYYYEDVRKKRTACSVKLEGRWHRMCTHLIYEKVYVFS